MGLFTKKKKTKFELIPDAPGQGEARDYLEGLYQADISHPERQIADLTGTEQDIQSQLANWLTASSENFDTATGYYKDVLEGGYDPETSRYYQGIRNQLDRGKEEGQAGVRRTAQKAGSSRSTPFLGVEASVGQKFEDAKNVTLGGLLQDERRFKAGSAGALTAAGSQRVRDIGAAGEVAERPREIEQARFDAAYQKILQDLLAPYTYQADIATQILNEPRFQGVQTGGGQKDWVTDTQGIGAMAAALSDRRAKENIEPIDGALAKVEELTGYTYNYKENSPEIRNGGVMAQDLEKVLPDAVFEKDGVKYVKYDAVIGLLVSAVGELSKKVA